MLIRISALAAAVVLAGCVSTNTTSDETTAAAAGPSQAITAQKADFHTNAASAEQIASRLWNAGLPAEVVLPDASELEDLWQRIQFQMTFNVPQTRPIIEQRNFYSSNQAYLDRVATRAQPFLYFIVQELERRKMPLELALLPIVESAFDPFAFSHAAASGMWQFMPATGKRFGLTQNFWYDGRRDVIAATGAALDYLQYLHDTLEGDWLNAIAAYNSGEGRILKAIKNNKKRRLPTDFWSLDLPAETTAYVPKLLALVDILKRPDDFDIVWKFIANEQKIAVVDLRAQIDLAIAADMAGITVAEIQALNPGLSQWATSPDGPHRLALPSQNIEQFQTALAKTPQKDWLRWERYTVKKGDTIGKIAQQHNTDIGVIQRINKLSGNTIKLGQHLLLPTAAADISEQPGILASRGIANTKLNKQAYTVQAGDTLWDISRKYNVTVQDLTKWNGITRQAALKPGQTLVVLQSDIVVAGNSSTRTVKYKVRKGDSLARIAQRFSITVADIIKWNGIDSNSYIQPGQQLKLLVGITQV